MNTFRVRNQYSLLSKCEVFEYDIHSRQLLVLETLVTLANHLNSKSGQSCTSEILSVVDIRL